MMTDKVNVPDWSLQLTEQLLSPSTHIISPLPSSAMIVHDEQNKNVQFKDYIDRHFKGRDATLLKNRISDTPTLRNSTSLPAKQNWKLDDTEKAIVEDDNSNWIGGCLFLFGFLFPPCWWIGSFWPRQIESKIADRWQKLNRIMSIGFSTILIIVIIIFAILYTKQ